MYDRELKDKYVNFSMMLKNQNGIMKDLSDCNRFRIGNNQMEFHLMISKYYRNRLIKH
jgi:hypothetical protein